MPENLQNKIKPVIIAVISASWLLLSACFAGQPPHMQETAPINPETEKVGLHMSDAIQLLMDTLGCQEKTAESMKTMLQSAGISEIQDILLVEDKIYHILKITDDRQQIYYAWVGRGYFLEKITQDTPDGKMIYHAMQ